MQNAALHTSGFSNNFVVVVIHVCTGSDDESNSIAT